MVHDISQVVERLEGLLQVERHMIREGNFDGLETLAQEKEKALLALTTEGRKAPDILARLDRIREIASRNQSLIGAALKGVRAAQRRLEMIQRASKSISSYDQLGRSRTIGGGANNIEHRA